MGFFDKKTCSVCENSFRGNLTLKGGAPLCGDCFEKSGISMFTDFRLISVERIKEAIEEKKRFDLKHAHGLPIADGASTTICELEDSFVFKSGGNNFTIMKDKITDISKKTDTEIQQQKVSSVGGAVGGALLFGALGAVIGGQAKNYTTETHRSYLIFTYLNKNDEIAYLCFEIYATHLHANVEKLIKGFTPTATKNVEL